MHKASQKLNEYLVAEKRKDQEEHSLVVDELVTRPISDSNSGCKYIQEADITLQSSENILSESLNNGGEPDQKFLIQLNQDEEDLNETLQYNHVININSGQFYI